MSKHKKEPEKISDLLCTVINTLTNKCTIIKAADEFILAGMFKIALRNEDFKVCQQIKTEIESRITKGVICSESMAKIKDYSGLNGLFDNYKQ